MIGPRCFCVVMDDDAVPSFRFDSGKGGAGAAKSRWMPFFVLVRWDSLDSMRTRLGGLRDARMKKRRGRTPPFPGHAASMGMILKTPYPEPVTY